jgi:hypothetical protein
MIFQVGKVYQGYEVESRTKCFVKFAGETKRRKIEVFEGVETAPVYTYPQGIETIVDVTAKEDVAVEATPEPIIEIAEIINPTPVTGAIDAEPIVVADSNNQQWRLVSVDDEYCNFEAVEHREIGCNPRTRKMATKALQKLYGWDKPKCKFTRPLIGENGIEVHTDDRRYGFALAEPIWAKRTDDPEFDLDFERERMQQMFDRDCDRAADFGMSARYGCGALI